MPPPSTARAISDGDPRYLGGDARSDRKARLALLPLMVRSSAPRPVIVRSSVTLSSSPPSTIGWSASDASNVIVSASDEALRPERLAGASPPRCPPRWSPRTRRAQAGAPEFPYGAFVDGPRTPPSGNVPLTCPTIDDGCSAESSWLSLSLDWNVAFPHWPASTNEKAVCPGADRGPGLQAPAGEGCLVVLSSPAGFRYVVRFWVARVACRPTRLLPGPLVQAPSR